MGAGLRIAWVLCTACGCPHLDGGDPDIPLSPTRSCRACGTNIDAVPGLHGNPLAAWDAYVLNGIVALSRTTPSVVARGTRGCLPVDDVTLVDQGLPTASAAEIGAARVLEARLHTAAGVPTVRPAPAA